VFVEGGREAGGLMAKRRTLLPTAPGRTRAAGDGRERRGEEGDVGMDMRKAEEGEVTLSKAKTEKVRIVTAYHLWYTVTIPLLPSLVSASVHSSVLFSYFSDSNEGEKRY
jgi:hypothetical protein